MDKQLDLKNIALIGRTFEEYYRMFDLGNLPANENILDVASGVSSFCAEASIKGYNVTASDRIYTSSPLEIEKKCRQDLDEVIKQMPGLVELFTWNFFKDIRSLRAQREKAYKLFIENFKKNKSKTYIPVEYPATDFIDNQFTISLVSHLLFLYEDLINYDLHKKIILELLRITSKEIRIFPLVNLKGKKSSLIGTLLQDKDLGQYQISVKKVNYEFMKNGNEMMIIKH
ncbi:MAG: hypothetical protein O8C61_07125 [Candidatus Methanoperedens sp.]|nr:hypothetical protein [Candidatus Methanoperedens sp.]